MISVSTDLKRTSAIVRPCSHPYLRSHEGKIDEARLIDRVEDVLSGFPVVGGSCEEDGGNEGLWVSIVEREPTGLDLDHDAVAGEEDVVGVGQCEAIGLGFVGRDGCGVLEAFAIAAAEYVHRDTELVAAQLGRTSDFVGVDIDELDDPVGVAAGSAGYEVGDGLASDGDRSGENI